MSGLIDLVDAYIFSGLPSNFAYDILKSAWAKAHHKTWQALYLDSFRRAVEEAKPILGKYAGSSGIIDLDDQALDNALRGDLYVDVSVASLAELTDDQFLTRLSQAMVDHSVLVIGGHTLSADDYRQLLQNLVNHARANFRMAVLADEAAFRRALLEEGERSLGNTVATQSLLVEVLAYLRDRFDLVIEEIREVKGDLQSVAGDVTEIKQMLFELISEGELRGGEQSASLSTGPVRSDADQIADIARQLVPTLEAILSHWASRGELRGLVATLGGPRPDPNILSPSIYAPRQQVITDLCKRLSNTDWLAFLGGPGSGKTQLARALAEASQAKAVRWVLLGGQRDPRSHLDEQLALWFTELAHQRRIQVFPLALGLDVLAGQISRLVGRDGLLIIDDVPDPVENDLLFVGIKLLLDNFSHYGMKVVTTSQREPPAGIQLQAGSKLTIVQAPPFLEDDVRDMLKGAGAPLESMRGDPVSLILGTTYGHPSLVVGKINWLKKHNWEMNKDEVLGLLGSEPVKAIHAEELRRLPRYLDEQPRRFLYRLSLLIDSFDKALAMKLAVVAPPIAYPNEALQDLVGPCLDRLEGDRLKVNPVLRDAGIDNLPKNEQQQVHLVAARHYLAQRTIEATQVFPISIHLWGAGDLRRWVGFLVEVMIDIKTRSQARYFEWICGFFTQGMAWPAEMDLDSKIMLRTIQVKIGTLAGRDPTILNEELEQLIGQAQPENNSAVILANGNTGPFLEGAPADIALKRAMRMVRLLHQSDLVSEENLALQFEDIIWLAAARLKGAEGLREFLAQVEGMTNEQRILLFDSQLAIESTSHMIDGAWVAEAAKPAEQRDWAAVMALFDRVREIAALWQSIPLQVGEAHARAVVLGDYLGRRNAAIELLEQIARPSNPDLLFLVDFTLGGALYDAGSLSDSLARLDATVGIGSAFGYYRLSAKILGAIIKAKQGDLLDAKKRYIDAIHTAALFPLLTLYDRLAVMGELAWVHWNSGNRQKAFGAMYGLVSGLLNVKETDEPRYRELFNKASHALGWIVVVVSTGHPPAKAMDGGAYLAPDAGFFGITRENLQNYSPQRGFSKAMLVTQLGLFADEVGLWRSAHYTLELGSTFPDGAAYQPLMDSVKPERATFAALYGEADDSIRLALDGMQSLARAKKLREGNLDMFRTDLSAQDAWRSFPPEDRKEFERQLLWEVFGPAVAELMGRGAEKDEALNHIERFKDALAVHRHELQDFGWWEEVIAFLKQMLRVYASDEIIPVMPDIPEDNRVLKILGYLAFSRNGSTNPRDSFVAQVNAVSSLLSAKELARHMLPGVGRYIFRYWIEAANSRGFALNQPRLIREQLQGVATKEGATTAVRVLKIAGYATGVQIPADVLEVFNQADHSN